MPLLDTPAIALKSRKWGEADRIVTFFTLRYGKIRGVARGARRQKSQLGSGLEPFIHSHLQLFEKPNDTLFRIRHVDIINPFLLLRDDLAMLAAAARMVNTVAAVTADGDPDAPVYDALLMGLRTLAEGAEPAMTALLFQVRMMGHIGFRPQMDHCAGCGKSLSGHGGQFSPKSGGLLCAFCAARQSVYCVALSPGSLALLQQAVRMPPAMWSRLRAEGRVRTELESAVERYIGSIAGRPLPRMDWEHDAPGVHGRTIERTAPHRAGQPVDDLGRNA
ncbi:MAG: DNA repair protein RecO [Nitrospiraceae bacterium]